ncbi:hypothetical protein XPN_4495, partial [Xanthomonas arboricola pv. pruni MAFF 301427]
MRIGHAHGDGDAAASAAPGRCAAARARPGSRAQRRAALGHPWRRGVARSGGPEPATDNSGDRSRHAARYARARCHIVHHRCGGTGTACPPGSGPTCTVCVGAVGPAARPDPRTVGAGGSGRHPSGRLRPDHRHRPAAGGGRTSRRADPQHVGNRACRCL